MTDATKLRLGLEAYRDALVQHLTSLGEQHTRMATAWGRLREGYQGRGAEAFAEVWERSDTRFREYIDSSAAIRQIIENQLERLQRFDNPSEPGL